jgi:hypothetical protein
MEERSGASNDKEGWNIAGKEFGNKGRTAHLVNTIIPLN